jgi:signal transduction histidine kinase
MAGRVPSDRSTATSAAEPTPDSAVSVAPAGCRSISSPAPATKGTNDLRDGDPPTPRLPQDDALLAVKLEALAEFAAGAGHEINNPLAAISGRAQLLLMGETDPERRRHLITIGAQALRIRDMIGDAMLFARPPEPQPEPVPFAEALARTETNLTEQLFEKQLSLCGDRDPGIALHADRVQLEIVLSELLRNAIRFAPAGSPIDVDLRRGDGDTATIIVRDRGPGLSEIDREHLFDPFYSGRQAGRGLGFGLPKCWRIVTLHGGGIRPDESDGFAMHVEWPIAPPTR